MSKPAFVFVHGAWHDPACWNRVTQRLEDQGYKCVAPALPSTHASPPIPDLTPDAEAVRSAVTGLLDEGMKVIVVCHSYGGIPTGEALKDLDLKTRQDKKLPGGVIRLVYIAAYMVPEGFQHSSKGTRENLHPSMETNVDAGIMTVSPEGAKVLFYQDMSDEEALELGRTIRPMSLGPFWSTTTFAAWRYIPSTFVVCTKDNPATVAGTEMAVKGAQDAEPTGLDTVIRREVGHSPFYTQPEWTVEMLLEAARASTA